MTATAHATLADLLACDGKAELIDGEIFRMSPASGRHGFIETNLLALLSLHARRRGLGRCFSGDTGFLVARSPDTVLCPDASFVSNQRLPVLPEHGFPEVVPELVAEVVSPSDAWSDVEAKVQRWLSLGALLVWVVDPVSRCIHAHRPGTAIEVIRAGDRLRAASVLPDFDEPAADVFG